ncbi:unnamed protein product [Moneuplotes crassus]|uniref:Uncharacterized protein n=1 Tax=Euplotes crassus TaxID=5936 RepID=A0AAD2D744_EUPCR|nr:unnamed protein product [Moneuplotes crassus]
MAYRSEPLIPKSNKPWQLCKAQKLIITYFPYATTLNLEFRIQLVKTQRPNDFNLLSEFILNALLTLRLLIIALFNVTSKTE